MDMSNTVTESCQHCTLADQAIEILNQQCFCISLADGAIRQALQDELASPALFALLEERCPHLFSAHPVFVSESQTERMAALIRAVEFVVALPAWRERVLRDAPAIARHDPGGAKGVFFGYDFHVQDEHLGLIEINTNAGGAMLNAVLARAQHACCAVMEGVVSHAATAAKFEDAMVGMFRNEWSLSGRSGPLRTIAIVDEAPEQQYLYPEFMLFRQLFERHDLRAVIADPAALTWRDGVLWHDDTPIDLVYNRLTDFMLEAPSSAALRQAYLAHRVVLTPHPQAHALYADKRNLALLTDAACLQEMAVPQAVQDILLKGIPRTEVVDPSQAERLWSERRHLFFKPTAGYGGRAAYRGDKLTRRVWQDILAGHYVAQALVAPGERIIGPSENPARLKFDMRSYTYDGQVQWNAARMYQGQTTNFRTPGGGFAPVYSIPDEQLAREIDSIGRMVAAPIE